MEKDDELKGAGNSYDFGARLYDPRVARWMSVDPLASKYPAFSPYCFVANSPLRYIDPDGKDIKPVINASADGKWEVNTIHDLGSASNQLGYRNGWMQIQRKRFLFMDMQAKKA